MEGRTRGSLALRRGPRAVAGGGRNGNLPGSSRPGAEGLCGVAPSPDGAGKDTRGKGPGPGDPGVRGEGRVPRGAHRRERGGGRGPNPQAGGGTRGGAPGTK